MSKRVVPCQQTLDMSAEKSRLLCSGQAQTVFAGIPLTLGDERNCDWSRDYSLQS